MKHKVTVKQIDDILPQTQCGLCEYNGCKPYAEAIVNQNEDIHRCPPGGVKGLLKLAEITGQDATPFIETVRNKEKPKLLARIREDECIGCTKCITACPVDAILGASKYMHSVIESECTGCELCVKPCPVDCIDMVELGKLGDANHYRMRYENHNERLKKQKTSLKRKHELAKLSYKQVSNKRENLAARKKAITEAVERVRRRAED